MFDDFRSRLRRKLSATTLYNKIIARRTIAPAWWPTNLPSELHDPCDHFDYLQSGFPPGEYARYTALMSSGLFNPAWYLQTYPDVAAQNSDPLEHFLKSGSREGRNPSSVFHTEWYLSQYPDVREAGMVAVYHYYLFGMQENRLPNALFSAKWYLAQYPEVALSHLHPLAHYEQHGVAGGYKPHPEFNTAWLEQQYFMQDSAYPNPLAAYFAGALKHHKVAPEFDVAWYTANNAGMTRTSPHAIVDYVNREPWQHAERNSLERSRNQKLREMALGLDIPLAERKRWRSTRHVAVGIVGFNDNIAILKRCFNSSLVALNHADIAQQSRILFVQNGEPSEINSRYDSVDVLPSKGNIGFGCGHNYLMKHAFADPKTTHYLALNPDAILTPQAITALLEMSLASNDNALLESVQFPDEHPKVYDFCTFDTPWASGASLLIPRSIYTVLQGFDPNFFMYCEDVDLSWRAKLAGFKVKTCPRSIAYHATGQRRFCAKEHRRFLVAGHLLAHKWGHEAFKAKTLADYHDHYPGHASEWPVPSPAVTSYASGIADFDNLFYFSEMRW